MVVTVAVAADAVVRREGRAMVGAGLVAVAKGARVASVEVAMVVGKSMLCRFQTGT